MHAPTTNATTAQLDRDLEALSQGLSMSSSWRQAQNAQQLNLPHPTLELKPDMTALLALIESSAALGRGRAVLPQLLQAKPQELADLLHAGSAREWLLQGDLTELERAASLVTAYCAPRSASLCSITNVKSGRCSEDCKWCAQSKHYPTHIAAYEIKPAEQCLREAQDYYAHGVEFYSLVASGRAPSSKEFAHLLAILDTIRAKCPIKLCVSLGLVSKEQLSALKEHGVVRYHCNLETASSYFDQVCTSHTFNDKLAVLRSAAELGLEVCSGALFNIGESLAQRLELALTLRQLNIKSIPLNFLHPIAGTPLEHQAPLDEDEVRRTIYLMRMINPCAYLRWAGGRILLAPELIASATASAMNAAITGNLLTTTGSTMAQDRALFAAHYDLPPQPAATAATAAATAAPAAISQQAIPCAMSTAQPVALTGTAPAPVQSTPASTACAPAAPKLASPALAAPTAATLAQDAPTLAAAAEWQRIKARLCPDFDRKHLWHPYTSACEPLPALKVKSAQGVTLRLDDGTELIDGMSSWWCCNLGYNLPELNAALSNQAQQLAHVMFAGFTHEPAIALGQRLLKLMPGMEHIFYADSGSVATEVALKMALQYQVAQGKSERNSFLTFTGGYHGDTWNAMSVSDPSGMHELFHASKYQRYFAQDELPRYTDTELLARAQPEAQPEAMTEPLTGIQTKTSPTSLIPDFAAKIEALSGQLAAVILEPIVQGAGGMTFYAPEVLQAVATLCRQHDILLIADEIATGFGRTGKMFACEHAGITPDLMLLGKGLTGGYMTLSAVLCTKQVAATISHSAYGPQVFMHGPTFMANPLACSVACAAVDYLESHQVLTQVKRVSAQLKADLAQLAARYRELDPSMVQNAITSIRAFGAIGVVEFAQRVPVEAVEYLCYHYGVWLRPMGQLLYTMPALIMDEQELTHVTAALSAIALKVATGNLPELSAPPRSPYDSAV